MGSGLIADVPAQHRLSSSNPTFRGNLMVTEGAVAGTAILAQPQGVILQDLPFSVELKKFVVEYYDTGMPKLFASDIVIQDLETGESKEARVEVNHPAYHRGVAIYQSSFDDGGSKVVLKALPLGVPVKPFEVTGNIGGSANLTNGAEQLRLEFTGLRVINVENFANQDTQGVDVRKVDLRQSIESRLGSGHKTATSKELRNVGPSVSYKLRDSAGQAIEYNNYMLPVDVDGQRMFLLGMRETPSEPMRYLRVPVDENDSMDGFVRSELKKVFPEATLTELPSDHPIFRQRYNFPNGLPKIHEHDGKRPQAFGIFIEKRLVLLYTFECDLGDGWEDPEVNNDPKEIREKALKMGANIVHYIFNN
jgi:cytochrome c biogenesis protein